MMATKIVIRREVATAEKMTMARFRCRATRIQTRIRRLDTVVAMIRQLDMVVATAAKPGGRPPNQTATARRIRHRVDMGVALKIVRKIMVLGMIARDHPPRSRISRNANRGAATTLCNRRRAKHPNRPPRRRALMRRRPSANHPPPLARPSHGGQTHRVSRPRQNKIQRRHRNNSHRRARKRAMTKAAKATRVKKTTPAIE
jgi:hypothetical protein